MKNQSKNARGRAGAGLIKDRSVRALMEFASSKLPEASIEEQILLYQALGEALPKARQRAMASEVARALSLTAALQLNLKRELGAEQRLGRTGGAR